MKIIISLETLQTCFGTSSFSREQVPFCNLILWALLLFFFKKSNWWLLRRFFPQISCFSKHLNNHQPSFITLQMEWLRVGSCEGRGFGEGLWIRGVDAVWIHSVVDWKSSIDWGPMKKIHFKFRIKFESKIR